MPVAMDDLADDLVAETAVLRGLLELLAEEQWRLATPAAGWAIIDQVTHLAHYDEMATLSATDSDGFVARFEREMAAGGPDPDAIAVQNRSRSGAEALAWFDQARGRLLTVFRELDPSLRLQWYGPSMSAASSITARIMETWAHGQDVADTLGVVREPTARLRHIAHIGVAARAFSFVNRGLEVPEAPIRVELAAPDGDTWSWGPEDADNRVAADALEFCLLVTQRRHRDDVVIEVAGPDAEAWIVGAQAFAGPPGGGRRPGDFA